MHHHSAFATFIALSVSLFVGTGCVTSVDPTDPNAESTADDAADLAATVGETSLGILEAEQVGKGFGDFGGQIPPQGPSVPFGPGYGPGLGYGAYAGYGPGLGCGSCGGYASMPYWYIPGCPCGDVPGYGTLPGYGGVPGQGYAPGYGNVPPQGYQPGYPGGPPFEQGAGKLGGY
jgi:hypothetical protein